MKSYLKYAFVLFICLAAFTIPTTRAMENMNNNENESISQEELNEALHNAIKSKDWNAIEPLLKRGANPNNKQHGIAPLNAIAWFFNQPDILLLLLKYNADPNGVDKSNNNPLHKAKHARDMELLLKHGSNPNTQNTDGLTPLHRALTTESVEILLKCGADPTIRNNNGNTPLEYTIKYNQQEMKAALQAWTKKQNPRIMEVILTIRKLELNIPSDVICSITNVILKNKMES